MDASLTLSWSEIFAVMQRPLVACLLLPGILVYYGLHVVRRGIIFVDLALAQIATLGTCVCLLLGHDATDIHTYYWSLGFTLVGALIFTFTRPPRHARVPLEALVGIVYVVAAAAGILLLSKSAHGKEELQKTLVGDLLTVSWSRIWVTAGLYAAIGATHWVFRRHIIAISFRPDEARARGMKVRLWDFIFYALFGLVVTSFVHVGGVLLVFSYLIVPAVCGNYLTPSLRAALGIGWGVATVSSVAGLYVSYRFDVPTGAAVVCVLGVALLVATGVVWARREKPIGV